jgi:hypothetical protein
MKNRKRIVGTGNDRRQTTGIGDGGNDEWQKLGTVNDRRPGNEANNASTITTADDPVPTNSPASNCSQGGFQMLVGDDERHHTDTNSRSNGQRLGR